jgi:[acyl-carrier-protein] S-malonyltransferase
VASGALGFEEAVCLVQARGRFMQEAVPPGRGSMAAVIGCPASVVEEACAAARGETGGTVEPANYNAPQQTVVAGDALAVEAACIRARKAGARRTIPLAVSAPFHCNLMAPAAEKLAGELARVRFADPSPPLVTNVEAAANRDGDRVAGLLTRQITEAVRFTEMVQHLVELGVTGVLEIGPGRVLSGLVGRIDRRLARASLASMGELSPALEFVYQNRP